MMMIMTTMTKSNRQSSSTHSYLFLATSWVAVWFAVRLLQSRARKKARMVAERASKVVAEGLLIDISDPHVRNDVLRTAIKRASQWMSFQGDEPPKPMVGQVGGVSGDKRRLLSIPPDYVLKPVNEKEYRGLREVAFYEAIKMAFSHTSSQFAIAGLDGKDTATDTAYSAVISEHVEMLAMWLAIVLHDQDVVSSETVLLASWRELRREMDLLRRLSQFTAEYYGVCSLTPQGNHILLQDLTASFYKPCVMDLKMGTQSFEPDASAEKRQKEISKYPQQAEFGLRIVGIRKYAPKHSEADHDGYLYRCKMYGRALSTREQIQQEMVNFFLDPDSGEIRRQTVSKVIISLKLLRKWFDDNKRFRFYSSSILIIFEGMTRREDSAKVRMVDFGHVRRQLGGDESYRLGLTTLTNILTELLTENDSLT